MPVKNDLGSLIGTKEILTSVVAKLSSQILLFSTAIIVFLLVSFFIWQENALMPAASIIIVFLIASAGYLFFEQKQKIEKEEPEAMNNLLGNKLKKISHHQNSIVSEEDLSINLYAEKIYDSGMSRDIEAVPEESKSSFNIGDKINIVFNSSKDCYLTLLNIGTSGKLTILFPNKLHQDNFIKGGQTYKIPGNEYGFEYQLKGPQGIEKLKAIVTESKINFIDTHFSPAGELFNTVSPGAAARDINIIEKKIEELPDGKWNESYFEFKIT